jgi:hypothetical protein
MHAIDLDAGTCVVGLPLLQGDVEMRQEITVPLCAGRRTEIYLDASDSMLSPRQLDVTTAALRIVPANATPSLDDPGFRAAEDARLALMEGRIVVDDNLLEAASRDAVDSPLLVMHYACSLTAAPAVDVQRLLGLCEALERGPLRGMADVILLRALVDHLRDPDGPSGLQLEDPLCVAASWAIAARLQVRFSRPVQQAVCLWRRASPVWTQTQIPGEGLPQGASAAPPHLLSLLRRGMEEDPLSPQAVIRETARAWMVDQDLVSELAFESAAGIVNYSNS